MPGLRPRQALGRRETMGSRLLLPAPTRARGRRIRGPAPRGLDQLDTQSLGLPEGEVDPVTVAQPHADWPALAVLSEDSPGELAVDLPALLAFRHEAAPL